MGAELPNPITVAPELRTVLAHVTDPRKPRGVRHGLAVVLTTAVCAVAAGARSFVAIAEWVANLPSTVAEHLGTAARCPSNSTIRRVVRGAGAPCTVRVTSTERCAREGLRLPAPTPGPRRRPPPRHAQRQPLLQRGQVDDGDAGQLRHVGVDVTRQPEVADQGADARSAR